eukprot:scaffold231580_cov31-Tisochrysis_lutea.AAC.1
MTNLLALSCHLDVGIAWARRNKARTLSFQAPRSSLILANMAHTRASMQRMAIERKMSPCRHGHVSPTLLHPVRSYLTLHKCQFYLHLHADISLLAKMRAWDRHLVGDDTILEAGCTMRQDLGLTEGDF